jgi:DNA-binding NarL/FixJ family response regulator
MLDADTLSPEKRAIVCGITEGKTYQQIASELGLKLENVRYHVKWLRQKLCLNKAGIAAWAVRSGIT